MALNPSETLGDSVVFFTSTWPTLSIFSYCPWLNTSPSGIPIISSSVSLPSLDSLLLISAFLLIFSLIIPSSLSIIISGIILSSIADLACEVGNSFVCGHMCYFHLYYLFFKRFYCICICSWLVCIIGEGLCIFICNRLHVILYLSHKICITAISGGLVWVSCLFEGPCKVNFKGRPNFSRLVFFSSLDNLHCSRWTCLWC